MSACTEFVEHIWKPGSCKNCFCLRSDHQLAPSLPPPPRLPPRPELCRLEDEGVNGSPYSKPTIAVKPTMMSSEASDVWTEPSMSADVSQVIWRRTVGKHPLPKPQEDVPIVYLGSFRGVQRPPGSPTSADGHTRCPPAYTMVGLHSLETRGNPAFHPTGYPAEKAGREEKAAGSCSELPPAQESFRQKLATFAGLTPVCPQGTGPYLPAQPPPESLASEDDSDQRCSPSGDSEGGEYCSILDCCPAGPDASQAQGSQSSAGGGDCPTARWKQTSPEKDAAHWGTGPPETPPRLCSRKTPMSSEAATSSDGRSCGSRSSGSSSPFAVHLESDYCSLVKEPTPPGMPAPGDSGCHSLGPSAEPPPAAHPPREMVQPEPIYAESTKRKKAVPATSRSQAKAEPAAVPQGQLRSPNNTWAQKTAQGRGREREGLDPSVPVAATITVMAAHPEEDHRTIYLSSPDSAVGVQWPREPVSRVADAGAQETLRESQHHDGAPEKAHKGRPAIPPKLSKSSPGGSPVSPSAFPPADLSDGHSGPTGVGPQLSSRGLPDPAAPCRPNGVATPNTARVPPAAPSSAAFDQRRPRFQGGSWSLQSRIEEEEEVEHDLSNHGWGREKENGVPDHGSSSTWHRLRPPDSAAEPNNKVGAGMSKSASFAFEFPKDRSGLETFSPPPPPPKSRHLSKPMDKSSSDLEKASQGSTESLSQSCRGTHVSFTAGSTDSLASDSRTCSDGGPSSEPTHSPTDSLA